MHTTRLQALLRQRDALRDHWSRMSQAGGLPSRKALDPGRLRGWLPGLALTEPSGTSGLCVRFAGTHICCVAGGEVRGQRQTGWRGEGALSWFEPFHEAYRSGQPIAGIHNSDGYLHLWLRLPVFCTHSDRRLVLAFDRYSDVPWTMFQTASMSRAVDRGGAKLKPSEDQRSGRQAA